MLAETVDILAAVLEESARLAVVILALLTWAQESEAESEEETSDRPDTEALDLPRRTDPQPRLEDLIKRVMRARRLVGEGIVKCEGGSSRRSSSSRRRRIDDHGEEN